MHGALSEGLCVNAKTPEGCTGPGWPIEQQWQPALVAAVQYSTAVAPPVGLGQPSAAVPEAEYGAGLLYLREHALRVHALHHQQ